jgi:hypothetical protein
MINQSMIKKLAEAGLKFPGSEIYAAPGKSHAQSVRPPQ